MYQPNQSFENIMDRMLARIPNTFDKREGSVIWDALAPAALELESLYYALDGIIQETFADTSSRDFLKLRAKERGMLPFPATKAIIKGQFDVPVNIGIRFKIKGIIYNTIEVISHEDHTYKLECDSPGEIGNISTGDLIQVDYVNGLNVSEIKEILVHGKDEEDTEKFRKRYFDSFEEQAFGGNIKDYTDKTLSIKGVGAVKVTPVHNGGGTVKLTILDSLNNKAPSELINQVQKVIDPNKNQDGLGLAPIGHIVTVDTVDEVNITIGIRAIFTGATNFSMKKEQLLEVINKYFNELKKGWTTQSITLRTAHIISRLLAIPNLEDISEIRINGTNNNLRLSDFQIPKLIDVVQL